ncbi:MAG: Extradiol ring-cleavage dioxygenase class protein subunit [Chloroflexi bacterium]|nr:Extradiol ring-cleavage dioxygenase class protein subunit [Chloroflexota bacterium]MDB5076588.1 Extradiol ring-cleavage dioxygenase class protein subunit [Chloroflexota bacterium]
MDTIVFACIAPHGELLIPQISGPHGDKAQASRMGMEELGRRMAAARPDTIVIVEPHSLLLDGAISLLDSARVEGTVVSDVIGPSRPEHRYTLSFEVDHALVAAITAASRATDVPVMRVRNFFERTPLSVIFGTMIPLWFMGSSFYPAPKVVVANVGNFHVNESKEWMTTLHYGQELPRDAYVGFGRAVRAAAAETGRRVAFIASLDLAHRHRADGPFGFDPAAEDCDATVLAAVRDNALDRLLEFDTAWVDRGLTEAIEPLLALHGVLEGSDLQAEVLSYEVPTYYGMSCVAYTRQP